jgi:DNA-binding transcriptional ArsR family regulator
MAQTGGRSTTSPRAARTNNGSVVIRPASLDTLIGSEKHDTKRKPVDASHRLLLTRRKNGVADPPRKNLLSKIAIPFPRRVLVSDSRDDSRRCAELLGALAAPERLRIVRLLRLGPRNVTEIAEELQAPAVNVSHHLNVLRHAGLVRNEKQGRFVVYSLAPNLVSDSEACDNLDLGCCTLQMQRDQLPSGD